MSSKKRNQEKKAEAHGRMYADYGEARNWPEGWSEAMLRGYDQRMKEIKALKEQQETDDERD